MTARSSIDDSLRKKRHQTQTLTSEKLKKGWIRSKQTTSAQLVYLAARCSKVASRSFPLPSKRCDTQTRGQLSPAPAPPPAFLPAFHWKTVHRTAETVSVAAAGRSAQNLRSTGRRSPGGIVARRRSIATDAAAGAVGADEPTTSIRESLFLVAEEDDVVGE